MTIAERQMRGKTAYLSGHAAEMTVQREYERSGFELAERRWRGTAGEVDLIFRQGAALVFVEVKKSTGFAQAAIRVSARQVARLVSSAQEYLGREPAGLLTPARFDVALVNRVGEVSILENAIMES